MALSQPGANYKNRAHVHNKDPLLGRAIDDVMDKVQAVAIQTNASVTGKASAPSAPTAISVVNSNGHATLEITHHGAPAGTNYLIEYSTTPNFLKPVQIDNGISKSFQQYLKGLGPIYFRASSRFSTSESSKHVYFGTENNPTAVPF